MRLNLQQSYALSRKRGSLTSLFAFALSSFAALGVAFFVNAGTTTTLVKASDEESSVTVPDFSTETQAEEDSLSFTITASSLTDTSNSFKVTARSGSQPTIRNTIRPGYDAIYLTVDDENWTSWSEATTIGQAAVASAQESGEDYEAVTYNAYVYNIDTSSSNADIIIPEQIRSASDQITVNGVTKTVYYFVLNVVGIREYACASWEDGGAQIAEYAYNSTKSITIPDSVVSVEENAFPGAEEAGITFNLEASEATIKGEDSGWSENWTDSTSINYGVSYDSTASAAHTIGSESSKKFGVSDDYCIGSYLDLDGYDFYQPMWVSYDVVDSEGNIKLEDQVMQQPVTNTTLNVDAVGGTVGGETLAFNLDFSVPSGCMVDPDSIIFHNIYGAASTIIGSRSYTHPVTSEGPYYAVPKVSYSTTVYISDFFDYEAADSVSFGDYATFSIKLKMKNAEAYEALCSSQYKSNLKKIQSGELTIRILFDSIGLANYRFVYDLNGEEVTSTMSVETPIDYSVLNDGATFSFLIKKSDVGEGFSFSSLKELYLEGFNLKMDLFDYEDNATLTGSSLNTRFGSLSLLPSGKEAVKSIDLITIMIWVYVIFFALAIITAVSLYFIKKEKYKNDEFRRIVKKTYIKDALKNIFGLFLILSSLMFIIFRWGFLNNSITVYNPVDIFVIIFTVAGAIALGLFIKNAVVAIKLDRERKRKERLHIDQDVAEDGTN